MQVKAVKYVGLQQAHSGEAQAIRPGVICVVSKKKGWPLVLKF
jgi:hypothetical protein